MRPFEAIVDANTRAIAGDASAGLRPADFAASLPVAALTCIDPRLNPLFPEVLGLPKEQFIWLRNAGNIILEPMSGTMRSLALACAIKGAKEIAIIGHTDCQVRKTSTSQLTDAFRALGVERGALPENLTEFFGLFASERQNVLKTVEIARHSPLIGPRVPVHGLLVDIATGKLEWVVNGYQALELRDSTNAVAATVGGEMPDQFKNMVAFQIGEMKFPETKIGELATEGKDWLAREMSPNIMPAVYLSTQTPPTAQPPPETPVAQNPPTLRTPPRVASRPPVPPPMPRAIPPRRKQ